MIKSTPGFLVVLTSFFYSFFLAFLLPVDGFKDRSNYLYYAENSLHFLVSIYDSGFLTFFFNEPLFLISNHLVSLWFPPDFTLQLFIFLFSFLFAFSVLSYDKRLFFWLVLIILLPQVLKNNIMQLRQGYAVAMFTYAWLCMQGRSKWFVIFLTPFMHASFFIVLFFYIVYRLFVWVRLSFRLSSFFLGFVALISSFLVFYVAQLLGARQGVRYEQVEWDATGLAFLFWVVVFFLCLMHSRSWLKVHGFPVVMLLVYLVFYFSFPLSGRVFESTLPLLLLAGISMIGWKGLMFKFMLIFYFCYLYYVGSSQYFLGFAKDSSVSFF